MICQTCGLECGADGIVSECRSRSPIEAVNASNRLLNCKGRGTHLEGIDAMIVARAYAEERQQLAALAAELRAELAKLDIEIADNVPLAYTESRITTKILDRINNIVKGKG